MSQSTTRDLVPLVLELFQAQLILKAGSWQSVSDLTELIPANLAEECSRGTSPTDLGDLGPIEFGRARLSSHVIMSLEYLDLIEVRRGHGQEEVRLIGVPRQPPARWHAKPKQPLARPDTSAAPAAQGADKDAKAGAGKAAIDREPAPPAEGQDRPVAPLGSLGPSSHPETQGTAGAAVKAVLPEPQARQGHPAEPTKQVGKSRTITIKLPIKMRSLARLLVKRLGEEKAILLSDLLMEVQIEERRPRKTKQEQPT